MKQSASTTVGQMMIAGLTADPKDAPGPFGDYDLAGNNRMDRSVTVAGKDAMGRRTGSSRPPPVSAWR